MRLNETTVLAFLFKRFRWPLAAAAAGSLVSGSCSVLLLTQINFALTAKHADLGRIGLKFAGAAVAVMLAGMLSRILFQHLRQTACAELRQFIAACALNAPYRRLEQLESSRVQAALSEHASRVTDLFVSIPTLLSNGAMIVGCLLYLVILSPRIFLLTLPFIALGALGYHLAHLRAIRHLRAGAVEQERLFGHFRALSDGAKELRLHRPKRLFFRDTVLRRSVEAVRRERSVGMSLFVAASSWGNFLIYAFLGVVLFVIAGEMPDRARVLTGFALVMVYMVNPLQALLLSLPEINLVKVAAEQINRLTREIEPHEPPQRDLPAMPFRSLALEGVKHRYYHEQSNEIFELGPIDLRFRPGEITFIVGGNGSGKTTLAKVLVGLYAPEEGAILLNDARVDDSNRDGYRQRFSAIFSDFHLFESLLDERGADMEVRGNRLLEKLQLQHKVQLRDGAFTTRNLSHGQRKRLALIVAHLEDRPILVFDEWAADQDPAFKEVFYHEILGELRERGKAAIVISHDDRYFHLADRIVRLENGQVVSVHVPATPAKSKLAPAAAGLLS